AASAAAHPQTAQRTGLLARFTRRAAEPRVFEEPNHRERRLVAEWDAKASAETDPARQAAYRAIARIVSALLIRHDRVWGSPELIASLATDLACNRAGSDAIGALVAPCIAEAAAKEGYKLLPRKDHPVVMNTKGASAAGKSTLRPLQKKLAAEIGVDWTDFALISPDIWRKQLLDYDSLGTAYKYAGAFSGDELAIVDEKLDRYMARKGERREMPHLLIDRFRFEPVAPGSGEAGSNLLTRFGENIYLFFVITPPASLVERAWNRGLEFGRYKAVDDTLAHSVEAYTGMPELFFTWVERRGKRLVFEFVDNSVPQGQRPRTIAFGTNEILNVLDVRRMIDIERFPRVDVDAKAPELLFRDAKLVAAEHNTGFLRACMGKFREIQFADQASGRIYLHIASGIPDWADAQALEQAAAAPDVRAGLVAVAPNFFDRPLGASGAPRYLPLATAPGAIPTLGQWGR
ncbi:MAG TPA: hypothetical protein VFJ48_00230, partial [Casimicrobiaceae bacterium]|nr:hypothetical protein [Casimicrobiaceae bacterium]